MQLYNKIDKRVLKQAMEQSNESRVTLSFYCYYNIKNVPFFRDFFYYNLTQINVLGRIYVASEGINGQISVPTENKEQLVSLMNDIDFLNGIRLNFAIEDDGKSFFKLIIKIKQKIVADGLNDDSFDVTDKGVHLSAKAFNEITSDENTVLIDMRNHYESEVGHFENAITPDVDTFKSSLPIVEDMIEDKKHKNIVMYCTGGIRCEKASAYFKHKGFENVFQLEGGIIEYARQVKEEGVDNKFKGKNFVFDERLGERISDEIISNCHQCGESCDDHINCENQACHLLFIQCNSCAKKHNKCCSEECSDFIKLSPEEQKEQRKGVNNGRMVFKKGRANKLPFYK